MRPAPDLSLYLVTDEELCAAAGHTVLETVTAAVDGGVTCVQLRAKSTDGAPFLQQVLAVARAVGERVPVIVNDRVDVFLAARQLGAPVAGVHVGQADLPAPVVRELIGEDTYLGLSAATATELRQAEVDGACDHVGIGVVRATATKTDAPDALGVTGVGQAARSTHLPAVAIGGIGPQDMAPLARQGLAGAAVVSAICCAADPQQAAAQLHQAWEEGKQV